MENLNQKFLKELSRTKSPEVFIGVAKILKVKLVDEKDPPEARDFTEIFRDTMSNYSNAGRARKRELLKILRKANEAEGRKSSGDNGGDYNSYNSKDTTTAVSD